MRVKSRRLQGSPAPEGPCSQWAGREPDQRYQRDNPGDRALGQTTLKQVSLENPEIVP